MKCLIENGHHRAWPGGAMTGELQRRCLLAFAAVWACPNGAND